MTELILHITPSGIQNKPAFDKFLSGLKEGKWLVTAKNFKRRSNNQNRYYHGQVLPLITQGLNDQGYRVDDEQTHEFLKSRFLAKKIANEDGEFIGVPGSTAKLTTTEFNEFIEHVRQFAAEFLGVQIPMPNEPLTINY